MLTLTEKEIKSRELIQLTEWVNITKDNNREFLHKEFLRLSADIERDVAIVMRGYSKCAIFVNDLVEGAD